MVLGSYAPLYTVFPDMGTFPLTSLATFAVDILQIYLLPFSHICVSLRPHSEGGISQKPFKSCLASLG